MLVYFTYNFNYETHTTIKAVGEKSIVKKCYNVFLL